MVSGSNPATRTKNKTTMKKTLTILLLSITSVIFAKGNDSIFDIKSPILFSKSNFNYNTQKINLKMSMYKEYSSSDRRTTGLVLLLAGLAFTTASILENDGAYGTWSNNPQPGNTYNQTYSTKPFIQQFPRNIMLFVGIGFTLTGGGIMINNK